LHAIGIIHGDLRPKNFLIDEYGIVKISDFKFAVKIPKDRLDNKPLELRGNPPYMAPELFTSEGVNSFQSDFWALGCVLYELRRGQPPFGDSANYSLERLMQNIRTIEPVNSPLNSPGATATINGTPVRDKQGKIVQQTASNNSIPPVTAELADLLHWLLEKAPMNRCGW
jgi:serine/threonine protein kinase